MNRDAYWDVHFIVAEDNAPSFLAPVCRMQDDLPLRRCSLARLLRLWPQIANLILETGKYHNLLRSSGVTWLFFSNGCFMSDLDSFLVP